MPCSNLRFLVVEDHEFQRQALVKLLNKLGAQAVHTAEDGHAALKVIRDPYRPVDIVVSDLSMPGMDGMEFVRHLSEAGTKVSLILASSLDTKLLASIGNMARAYKVNLLGVIDKPLAAAKLAPLIELHRAGAGVSEINGGTYSLDEVAEAWTHNEFEPCFQPKIDLATGRVRGMHAQARWAHPVQGMLEPQSFMPSIQARGLNDDFVWLMVQRSAAQCRRWKEKGHDLVVSVNVLFDSLTDVDLAARIKQIVETEGLEPRHVVLSVAEAALNTDLAKALENLARLRVDGFGLAIDDFGNGQMAVEQLSLVAFTELKIKSTFVSDAHTTESARAGLAVALEMAHQLNVRTVADGIRSKEEWKLLHEWGCDFGLGPFISEPLQKDAVLGWLAEWNSSTFQ